MAARFFGGLAADTLVRDRAEEGEGRYFAYVCER